MDKQYKRWKFWETWACVQILVGVCLFGIPMALRPTMFLAVVSLVGFLTIILGFVLWAIFSGKITHKNWLEKFDRCPNCGQGWIRKEE